MFPFLLCLIPLVLALVLRFRIDSAHDVLVVKIRAHIPKQSHGTASPHLRMIRTVRRKILVSGDEDDGEHHSRSEIVA